MEPVVTISLKDYERLKDLEYQFKFLIDRVKIEERSETRPDTLENIRYKIGRIDRKDLDFFYKNLLDIDELGVMEDVA